MTKVYLKSDNLHAAIYDDDTSELIIEFNNGSIYRYANVPRQVYESLINARSNGTYFNLNIKGYYQYQRVS